MKARTETREVVALSTVLNNLPLKKENNINHRNPNSVKVKLHNFMALDPNRHGQDLQGYCKLDKQIWDEFSNDRNRLSNTAKSIKDLVKYKSNISNLSEIEEYEDEEEVAFPEGTILYRIHRVRERNMSIVREAKELFLHKNGSLYCQVLPPLLVGGIFCFKLTQK